MKLFSKIFLSAMAAIILAISITEYFVISSSFHNALDREIESELATYSMMEYSLQSGLLNAWQSSYLNERTLAGIADSVAGLRAGEGYLVLYCDGSIIYTQIPEGWEMTDSIPVTDEEQLNYRIHTSGTHHLLSVWGSFSLNNQTYSLLTGTNIDSIFLEKEEMERQYNTVFLVVFIISIPLLYFLSWFLTRPIRRLSAAALNISMGNYNERVSRTSGDEIGELGGHFNRMAAAIEENIQNLKDQARQKEDFVNGFAHELKTPLTSIIGYADLLHQGKLDSEDQEKAHNYIFNEGLRLEALSHKMMELSVLNRQEFLLEDTEIREFFVHMNENIHMWLDGRGIIYHSEIEEGWVSLEPDLFQTLIMNLLDNAVKSGTAVIRVSGHQTSDGYEIRVTDEGCGIPEEELSRITEAFYMVDKSRSRKLHGAGLGLAIAKRIIDIHNGSLRYQSQLEVGTTAILTLPILEEGGTADE